MISALAFEPGIRLRSTDEQITETGYRGWSLIYSYDLNSTSNTEQRLRITSSNSTKSGPQSSDSQTLALVFLKSLPVLSPLLLRP